MGTFTEILELKDKSIAWLDIDCEVVAPCEDIWDLVPSNMVGLTREPRAFGFWWATGVIVVNNKPKLLSRWHNFLMKKTNTIRGDQEGLYKLVGIESHKNIQELPQKYQWLRLSLVIGKNISSKKIIHWTGVKGKTHIRNMIKGNHMAIKIEDEDEISELVRRKKCQFINC